MANTIRLKRRSTGGAAGAPTTLKTTEPAFNEVDNTLYLGYGDDGSGNATSIVPVAGKGAFVDLTSAQTIAGAKTFSTSPIAPTPTGGDNSTKVATTAFVASALSGAATGADTYQGTWNASTNSPSLVSSTGTKGHRYVVSTAGSTSINGITDWKVGDWIIFNGSIWEKVDNTDAVATVNGQTGTVVITKSDVGLANVPNTDATNPANITQSATYRFVSDTEKGTWNAKEPAITAGTASQYIKGDKTLGTLDKSAVGLANVANVDTSNPANITQSATYRFVTDTEKSTWNAKEPAITAGTSAQYLKGDKTLGTLNTAAVPESGSLYFTDARAIAAPLTGVNTATNGTVVATDSILIAAGKLQNQVTGRLIAANNLSDVGNAGTARGNLGLGTMATQAASGVAITGGTLDNIIIDGGTF